MQSPSLSQTSAPEARIKTHAYTHAHTFSHPDASSRGTHRGTKTRTHAHTFPSLYRHQLTGTHKDTHTRRYAYTNSHALSLTQIPALEAHSSKHKAPAKQTAPYRLSSLLLGLLPLTPPTRTHWLALMRTWRHKRETGRLW
jgi:hypothetical protein